jgi:hypothetical protein
MKKWLLIALLCLPAIVFTGCNLFGWASPTPTSAADYMNEGRRKLNDGDFSGALSDFRNAVNQNPNSSDARFAYAKARLLVSGVNSFDVLSSLSRFEMGSTNSDTIPFFNRRLWPDNTATDLYNALDEVNTMLEPIFHNRTTGTYASKDVALDYGLSQTVFSLLQMRDNYRNNVIHTGYGPTDDIDMNLLWTGGQFNFVNLDSLYLLRGPGFVDSLLANTSNFCGVLLDVIDNVLPDTTGFASGQLHSTVDSLRTLMNLYRVQYPVMDAVDNDADGLADESILGMNGIPHYRYFFRSRSPHTTIANYVIDSALTSNNGGDCGGVNDPTKPRAWTQTWVQGLLALRPGYIDSVFKVDSVRLAHNGGQP